MQRTYSRQINWRRWRQLQHLYTQKTYWWRSKLHTVKNLTFNWNNEWQRICFQKVGNIKQKNYEITTRKFFFLKWNREIVYSRFIFIVEQNLVVNNSKPLTVRLLLLRNTHEWRTIQLACVNTTSVTSSTKPEVLNVSQRRQRRIEPRAHSRQHVPKI